MAWSARAADNDKDLVVTEAFVTFEDENYDFADTLTIRGSNFDGLDGDLVVTLGDFGGLELLSATADEIVALCPEPGNVCHDGDFRIVVSVGPGGSEIFSDHYDLTISKPPDPVRINTFAEKGSDSCNYGCSDTAQQFSCSCSCGLGNPLPTTCTCGCEEFVVAHCEVPSCAAQLELQCPFVGGSQGQSQLASCSRGVADLENDRCIIGPVTGPPASCVETGIEACSCSCRTIGGGFPCSCSCLTPGTVSCTSPVRTVSIDAQAICLAVE
jgi:hypothetical protein